ncbi:hypothetical protein DTO164E3_5536 [Paecilomyces variotii]|nr:hypothetical protein DTO164E3_5536 [Paecilomyces variotii]KAJ9225665.1 hypothetical protein DTO169C6_2101 [Paecilomyces variotii]KAJ9248995.1 hypothetical protein DTO195F2_8641 [Paecilomyces variotii]KAJ9291885.1 hypothetical protein DTO021C3_325 [Paecilomyces variotii]KAJ9321076.1 hypothetical protein DTO027B3_7933 [Paecilomyces variotii]
MASEATAGLVPRSGKQLISAHRRCGDRSLDISFFETITTSDKIARGAVTLTTPVAKVLQWPFDGMQP